MISRKDFLMGGMVGFLGLAQDPPLKIEWSTQSSYQLLSRGYEFTPQPDITAYELAKVVAILCSGPKTVGRLFEEMPDIKRHFKELGK